MGRADDADTDSGSDADYAIENDLPTEPADNEKREKAARGNLELFQKR